MTDPQESAAQATPETDPPVEVTLEELDDLSGGGFEDGGHVVFITN